MPLTKAAIARIRDLRDKKHRDAAGLFVIEGAKVIGELVAAQFGFEEIYAAPGWSPPPDLPAGTTVIPVSAAEMARLSHYPTPSPVLAVAPIRRTELAPNALRGGVTLALDAIQDPGNVGTLLRIADWYALDRVLLSPDCADVFSQKAINASMGSFARVPTHVVPLADTLASATVPILGCELAGDDVHALGVVSDAVIVIGSEGQGLSPSVQARVTRRITIPRLGGAESLNAAVAAGIVCDQLRHPRR